MQKIKSDSYVSFGQEFKERHSSAPQLQRSFLAFRTVTVKIKFSLTFPQETLQVRANSILLP